MRDSGTPPGIRFSNWTQFGQNSLLLPCSGLYRRVLSPKLAELLSIAFDASITHMYAPGTRRHVEAALRHGATVEEIMEVLKICVAEGVEASNLGVPILAEELAGRSLSKTEPCSDSAEVQGCRGR